jgi:hypothetical protein
METLERLNPTTPIPGSGSQLRVGGGKVGAYDLTVLQCAVEAADQVRFADGLAQE